MRAWLAVIWLCMVAGLAAAAASAQEQVWVQIESHPSLSAAETAAGRYTGRVDSVNGFTNSAGWYSLALGPFSESDARTTLNRLLARGLIPRDSFLVDGTSFRQQFWPPGVILGEATQASPPAVAAPTEEVAEPTPAPEPEETRSQAIASERQLTREEREALQVALQWEGFYTSAIDGAFGPGTRNAMAAYQAEMGYRPTGVLTTRQRAELLGNYRAVLEEVGLRKVTSREAGIEMQLPMGLVEFTRFDPPFVHYEGDKGVRVLLISQEGTEATLAGLYDIMQSLEIVPLQGQRELQTSSFTLTGRDGEIHSHTYAEHKNGRIKGFTLIWPVGDERRRTRILREMRASFTPIEGVLDDTLGAPEGEQRIDLLAGLEIRRPALSRSGFYVDDQGTVLTTSEVIGQCSRFTIDEEYEAEVAATEPTLGLAVLRPKQSLAPIAFAQFSPGVPRLQSEVAVAGYSYEGALGAPTITFGKLTDLRDLDGNDARQRLAMTPLPGDAGGPVFDVSGAVVGVLLAREDGSRTLPEDVRFAAKVPAIAELLSATGISAAASEEGAAIAPEDLTVLAADMTVLVSCWN